VALTEGINGTTRGRKFAFTRQERYVEQRVGDPSHRRCDDDYARRPRCDDPGSVLDGSGVSQTGASEFVYDRGCG
jgi:hypothetical protein